MRIVLNAKTQEFARRYVFLAFLRKQRGNRRNEDEMKALLSSVIESLGTGGSARTFRFGFVSRPADGECQQVEPFLSLSLFLSIYLWRSLSVSPSRRRYFFACRCCVKRRARENKARGRKRNIFHASRRPVRKYAGGRAVYRKRALHLCRAICPTREHNREVGPATKHGREKTLRDLTLIFCEERVAKSLICVLFARFPGREPNSFSLIKRDDLVALARLSLYFTAQ